MLHIRASGPRSDADRGTVVFIHGFPFDGSMWEPQLDALPEGWRGLAPDLRGFGQSPMDDGTGDAPSGKRVGNGIAHADEPVLTMACLADDIAALIEEECDGPAVVCGLSMGGYVALELHRRHPDRLRGLVLADTRATADSDEARENRLRMAQTVRSSGTRPIASAMIPELLADSTRVARPELVDTVRSMILGTPPETVVAALAGMASRHDSTGELPGIDVPTLVVVGEHDAITPPDYARKMADGIPDATLAVIDGAGHLSGLENPGAFDLALREYLEGLD
ncbi:MAG: alpha/beta fold hydrolase [Longimicrobiales bacterium]|nr:alpha/beta fold hydrolase [Longimicrobiales bacterium]